MAEIVKIKKDGVIQYPITKPECVMDENGKNVLQLIKENGSSTLDPSKYATTQQLTELSTEVSELRENASLFEAVYGKTTRDEIIAAAEAKRHIICFYNNRIYNLTRYNPQGDLFFTCADDDVYTVICALSGRWSASRFAYMKQSSVVKNITDSSTDTQYPSAKAVYDFVNNTLGTIINGDY